MAAGLPPLARLGVGRGLFPSGDGSSGRSGVAALDAAALQRSWAPGRRPRDPRQGDGRSGRMGGAAAGPGSSCLRPSTFVFEPRVGVGRRPPLCGVRRRPRCSSAVLRRQQAGAARPLFSAWCGWWRPCLRSSPVWFDGGGGCCAALALSAREVEDGGGCGLRSCPRWQLPGFALVASAAISRAAVMICTAAFVAATGSLGVAVCRRPGPAAQSDDFDGGRHDLFVAVCVWDGDGGLAGPRVAGVRLQLSAGRKSCSCCGRTLFWPKLKIQILLPEHRVELCSGRS